VSDVEIALREALAKALIHGNHEDRRKHVHVTCRCEPDEVSIAVKDEGSGFDINTVPDPTARENIGSVHRRGILVMKAVMDEVRFEEQKVESLFMPERAPAKLRSANQGSTRERDELGSGYLRARVICPKW
jgi:anti-sigma regulatory factor (Ser/Thr protein kinase)